MTMQIMNSKVEEDYLDIGPKNIEENQPIVSFAKTKHGRWLKWEAGKEGRFKVEEHDGHGNQLTYTHISVPEGAEFRPENRTFSWRPTRQQAKIHTIKFLVSNGKSTAIREVIITVEDPAREPSRENQAKEIGRIIADKRTVLPLSIGIYNSSGEGRSFFLDMIEGELNALNDKKDRLITEQCNQTHTIRFDASEYKDQEKIWFSLLNNFFMKFEKEQGLVAKRKYIWTVVKKLWRKREQEVGFALLIIILLTMGALYFVENVLSESALLTTNLPAFQGVANSLILVTAILASTSKVVQKVFLPVYKKANALFIEPLSEEFSSKLKYPDYKQRLGSMEEVKETLDDLLHVWLKKSDDKVVVMVDHLERCSKEVIIEFFDALHLFLSNQNYKRIVFILPFDPVPVSLALASKNLNLLDDEKASKEEKFNVGRAALNSYITLPLEMSPSINYSRIIESSLPLLTSKHRLNLMLHEHHKAHEDTFLYTEEDQEKLKILISNINQMRHVSPREVNILINALLFSKERWKSISVMKKDLNYNRYKNFSLLNFRNQFLSIFLLEYFYPEIAKKIVANLDRNSATYKNKTFKEFRNALYLTASPADPVTPNSLDVFFEDLDHLQFNDKELHGLFLEYLLISHEISKKLLSS